MDADEAFAEAKKTGRWAEVLWFIDEIREKGFEREWEALGHPLAARRTANETLKCVFPPDFVRTWLNAPVPDFEDVISGKERVVEWFGGLVGLFEGHEPWADRSTP